MKTALIAILVLAVAGVEVLMLTRLAQPARVLAAATVWVEVPLLVWLSINWRQLSRRRRTGGSSED